MHSLPGNLPESVLMLYPALRSLPTEQLAAICPATALLKLPAGAQVFTEKQNCLGFPLILAGAIKVVKPVLAVQRRATTARRFYFRLLASRT